MEHLRGGQGTAVRGLVRLLAGLGHHLPTLLGIGMFALAFSGVGLSFIAAVDSVATPVALVVALMTLVTIRLPGAMVFLGIARVLAPFLDGAWYRDDTSPAPESIGDWLRWHAEQCGNFELSMSLRAMPLLLILFVSLSLGDLLFTELGVALGTAVAIAAAIYFLWLLILVAFLPLAATVHAWLDEDWEPPFTWSFLGREGTR